MSYGFGRINDLAYSINRNAASKGFYDQFEALMEHKELNEQEKEFIRTLWLSNRLMLCVSELAEALEAIRQDPPNMSREPKSGGFGEELADACIRIFDLGESSGINVEQAIVDKMEFNSTRPQRHGGRRI